MLENRDQGATVEHRRAIAYAMSLVWLLFLAFPLVTAFQGGLPTLAGALSILLTLAFAALYAAGTFAIPIGSPNRSRGKASRSSRYSSRCASRKCS